MKTMITRSLLLAATVFTMGTTQAAEPVRMDATTKRSSLERSLDRALNRYLTFPLTERTDMTGEVYVSFVVDKEGRVEVLDCSSTNPLLKDYVMRKLARIDIGDNPEGMWKTTHMRISFRPERTNA
jgi:hypothetical protein